ncbi:hypothetical protein WDW86_05190 [Bdellovibrionota bacterium FG-2]
MSPVDARLNPVGRGVEALTENVTLPPKPEVESVIGSSATLIAPLTELDEVASVGVGIVRVNTSLLTVSVATESN